MTVVLGLLALVILVPLAFVYLPGHKSRLERMFSVPSPHPIEFATIRKIEKPNQYLVCPVASCVERPDLIAPTYQVDAATLLVTFDKMVKADADVVERARNDQVMKIEYVQRTLRMRFPDLITVQFMDRGRGQSTVAIYSRSVYGYSDRGVNKARITAWLSRLDKALTL
jgi:uncharacterized protein (DUF1499 family)